MIEADQLQKAIEGLHRCSARLVQSVPVKETRKGTTVWYGVVHVFDLTGHPSATKVYAWSSPIAGSNERQFFAALHQGPITSPTEAVRAAIKRQEGSAGAWVVSGGFRIETPERLFLDRVDRHRGTRRVDPPRLRANRAAAPAIARKCGEAGIDHGLNR